ncbi:MAG: urease accessory protein UreD [Beijerinckiaceae bacterium]
MSRNAYPAEPPPVQAGLNLERSVGKARLDVARGEGGSHDIRNLAQSGCARLLFPARRTTDPLEAVIANIGGGLTGGDRFSMEGHLGAGAQAVFTTQAAEKIYRSDGAMTRVATRLSAAQGSILHWLPQETILFEGGSLSRRLDVEIAEGATALVAESMVLGRAAMGERLATARLSDSWRIRRGGRLVFAEETRVDGGWAEAFARKAALGSGTAGFATVVLSADDAEARIAGLRDTAAGHPVEAGVSAFDGLLVMRLLADSGLALRRAMTASLEYLAGRELPRIWRT